MYPYQIVFSNNAKTLLASSINSASTVATLSSGSGQFFPQISDGQAFTLTLSASPVGLVREIVLVTAINGDTITMIRGQEGTDALAWVAGTSAENRPTSEYLNSLTSINYNYAIGQGTGDIITAQLDTSITSIPDGFPIFIRAVSSNTVSNPSLTLTMGDVLQPSYNIVKGTNLPLAIGDIPGSGFPIELVFSQNYNAWVMINPQSESGSQQIQSNWIESNQSSPSFIQNKPALAAVATSADYNDLNNKPTILTQESGVWVPTLGDGTPITPSNARYVKTGKLIYINLTISLPSLTSTESFKVFGLPFSSLNYSCFYAYTWVNGGVVALTNDQAGANGIVLRPASNPINTISYSQMSNSILIISGTYITA